MKSKKRIVLAYSGGLDTSIILKWLQENYNAEVICYTADIGQEIDRKKIISNAKKFGVKNIIITLGEKGIYFANKNEEYFVEALKLKNEVVDTTGAGDAFNGAFAVALANELKYKDALIFANKVAGISTTRLGAASSMPFLTEVEGY